MKKTILMGMGNKKSKILFCFHDFSMTLAEKSLEIIQKLKNSLECSFPILVIPYTENATPAQISEFSAILQQLQSEKFELLLHGFKHSADISLNRTTYGRFALSITNKEAEFAGLNAKDTEILLEKALNAWAQLLPYSPKGFVAPTWHGNPFLKDCILNKGLIFENRFKIYGPNKKSLISPVASFAGIPEIIAKLSFLYGRALKEIPLGTPRIVLHPSDFPRFEKQIFNLIEKTQKKAKPIFYKDLF